MHIRFPRDATLLRTPEAVLRSRANLDIGAESFARDKLKCPTQGELFCILRRRLALKQDSPPFFLDYQMLDATVCCLANPFLNLFHKSQHESLTGRTVFSREAEDD